MVDRTISKVSARHKQIRLPDKLSTFADCFGKHITDAFRDAERLVEQVTAGKTIESPDIKKLLYEIGSSCEYCEAKHHLSLAISTNRAHLLLDEARKTNSVLRNGYNRWAWIKLASLSQIHLVECLLLIEPEERQRIRLFHERDVGSSNFDWKIKFCGALALARLIHILLTNDYLVFLPTLNEDVHDKIDLIARMYGSGDSFCFQVKSNSRSDEILLRVLRSEADALSLDDTRHIQGVKVFNGWNRGMYTAAVVIVGGECFETNGLEYIHDRPLTLIEELQRVGT